MLFRTDTGWTDSTHAMYAPWDRVALSGHGDWATRHSLYSWNSTRDINFVLSNVHEVLNADDYQGI
jgi:hypothetical protein